MFYGIGGVIAAAARDCIMKIITGCALGVVSLLLGAAPSFAQGVTQSPPAPNSGTSMPQPPDSLPQGARTLAPGSTGQERVGTVGTTVVEPPSGQAPAQK